MNIADMNIIRIKELLAGKEKVDDKIIIALSEDNREGVQRLYKQYCKRLVLEEKEKARLEKMLQYERNARDNGHNFIAGVDEAGRGPLAGCVVAAAVILPGDTVIMGVDDSKKLSSTKRQQLYYEITQKALSWSTGMASVEEIDRLNILQASLLAMNRAIKGLAQNPDFVLVDAVTIPGVLVPQQSVIKGDSLSLSIAAASIIAKVTRDKMMEQLDGEYPQYGFGNHKGYGTREHIEAICRFGPCPLHRKTFLKNMNLENRQASFW